MYIKAHVSDNGSACGYTSTYLPNSTTKRKKKKNA